MRLEPLELYILDCFRERQVTRLPLSDILGNATANRFEALATAIRELEGPHGMLQRGERKDVFELTPLGMKYLSLPNLR